MFKKVIGQQDHSHSHSHGDPSRATPPLPDLRRPETPAVSTTAPAHPAPNASVRPTAVATRNILSSDVEIKGTVKFTNDLVVDGKIDGEIFSEGNLIVAENARIKAEVKTATVIVFGKVHGNLTASDRIELKSSAEVIGDIKTKILSIEAGAIFVGKSTVGTPAQTPAQTPVQAPVQSQSPSSNQAQGQPKLAATPPAQATQTAQGIPKQGTLAGTQP